MSKYRFSISEKYAVWKTHGPNCRWCNEPVQYKACQIDHILPESIEKEKYEQLKRLYGLKEEFSLNSFYNWIPIHSGCNQSKSGDVFDGAPFVGQLIQRIGKKYDETIKLYNKWINEPNAAKIISNLERGIEERVLNSEDITDIKRIFNSYVENQQPLDISKYHDSVIEKQTGIKLDDILTTLERIKQKSKDYYNLGIAYAFSGDYEVARDNFENALKEYPNNTNVMCVLAYFNLNGIGGEKNQKKAYQLDMKAVELESALAMANLGYLFEQGFGVEKDLKMALYWSKMSADKGNSLGQNNLASFYLDGKAGINKNLDKALELFEKSANQGNGYGENNLGNFYLEGKGRIKKDISEAKKLYQLSANKLNPIGLISLGNLYLKGLGVEKNESKAFSLFLKSAEQGQDLAQFYVGKIYINGSGVTRNVSEGIIWLNKSIEQDNIDAQALLGLVYLTGNGVLKNTDKAFKLLTKSSEKGHPTAQGNLGAMYTRGDGIPKDYNKAFDLLTKSSEKNDEIGLLNLAFAYINGFGTEKDFNKAFSLLKRAKNLGSKKASNILGSFNNYLK